MHQSKLFLLLTLSFCVNGMNLPPGRNLHEIEALLSMVDMKTCGCSANPRCEIAIPQGRMMGVTCKKGVFCCKRKILGPEQPFATLLPLEIAGTKSKSEVTTPELELKGEILASKIQVKTRFAPKSKSEVTTHELEQKGEIPTSKIQVKTKPSDVKDNSITFVAKDKIEASKIKTKNITIIELQEETSMTHNSTAKPQLILQVSSALTTPKQQIETVTESVRVTPSKVKPLNIPENLFVDLSILGRAPIQGTPIKTTTSKSVKDDIKTRIVLKNKNNIEPKTPFIRPLPTKIPIRNPMRHPLPQKSLTTRLPAIRRNGPPAHPNNRIHPTRLTGPSRHLGRHPPTRSPAHPNNGIVLHLTRPTQPFHLPGIHPPSRPSTSGFRKPFPTQFPANRQPVRPNHRHVRPPPIDRSDNTRPRLVPHPRPAPQQSSVFQMATNVASSLWNIKWF